MPHRLRNIDLGAVMMLYAKIEQHVPALTNQSLLEAIGRNAMPIYVSHVLLLETYCFIANYYGDSSWSHALYLSIAMIVLFAIVLVRAYRSETEST